MKIGMRKPSLTRSLKARTTSKWKRQAKKAIIPGYGKKGMGWVKNPKKAMYNKVYHKTTFGLSDLFKPSKKKAKNNKQPLQYDSSRQHTSNKNKRGSFIFLIVSLILLFIVPPLGVLLLLVNFFVFIIKYFSSKKRKVTSSNPSVDKIIFHEDFLLMGTNYHKEEAEIAADFLSEGVHYFGKDNKSLKSYMLETYKPVYKYNKLKTVDVHLLPEPSNPHDQNAIQVLVNNIFVGYIPASIAAQISTYIANPNYRYDAILTGRGGPYKTLNIETERVISRESDLTYYLDLTLWHLAEK
ncbi:HIRAN domain-containing protein [Streptococcus mitis]|uniref:HIRAN domain protein n=1 Tax=Streptococcus mitis TaxID=28037 RepID=A0A428D4M9_STRMT|nr:HIRAN domain-containing protein [Streptococcus mitis]RSI87064.1 HIRAN domain protein [Streptococcus mitis]RSI90744.1 HIRAN domain protein [Streptococcus mitis]